VLAFDETHARSVVHPVGPVAAAALALCEQRRLDGRQLLTALIAGVEVTCRTSMAISVPPARGAIGWSQTGVCAGMGAAAAVGKLMGLDAGGLCAAIAFGANTSAGLRAMNGTMAATLAASNAAANGYRAAALAHAGVAAAADVLENPYGFVALFAEEGCLAHVTDKLGTHYAICETNFKPYPCGIVAHAAIDAARAMRSRPEFAAATVEQVHVTVHPSSLALGDRPAVATENEASVSIQYWVATALLRDNLGPECLGSAWLADAGRQALQQRVELFGDAALPRSSAQIAVRLSSGAELHGRIDDCLGSDRNPMRLEDIETKFADAASTRLTPARVQQIIATCRALDSLEDVGQFTRLLTA
jgi:2-methylcitrate dehydratase PrpD